MPDNLDVMSKTGVEIFSTGNWNGDDYTARDLQDMVDAFNETKDAIQPHLKLGHDPKQKLLQEDGLPAAGWISKLYIRGPKLVADFIDIPKKIYTLMQTKAYKKVSSEIFWNTTINGKKYRRFLGAVALLGADTPGVQNLSDILAMYKFDGAEKDNLKIYNNTLELDGSETKKGDHVSEKSENEIKLEFSLKQKDDELAKQKAQAEADQKAKADADKEIEDLKKFKAEAEAREAKHAAEVEAEKMKSFVTSLKAEKLCSPAMEPLVNELLGETKKEYSLKIGDEEKKLSKQDLLKETLKLFKAASSVNFAESSQGGKNGAAENDADEIDSKAKAYAKENGVTYGMAVKAIQKQMSKK